MSGEVPLWDGAMRLEINRPRHQVVQTGESESWKQGRGYRTGKVRTVPGGREERMDWTP